MQPPIYGQGTRLCMFEGRVQFLSLKVVSKFAPKKTVELKFGSNILQPPMYGRGTRLCMFEARVQFLSLKVVSKFAPKKNS